MTFLVPTHTSGRTSCSAFNLSFSTTLKDLKTLFQCTYFVSGYCFLLFQDEVSVQALIESCILDDDKLYWCVSSPTMKDKPVSHKFLQVSLSCTVIMSPNIQEGDIEFDADPVGVSVGATLSCEPVVGFLPNFHGYINGT